jgi:hypothetical protein
MKSILILCIAFAVAYPAQGFLLNTLTNAVNNVVNTVTNTIDSVQSTINTAQFVGQILWDNAFGPSWEMFLNSKKIIEKVVVKYLYNFYNRWK